MAGNAGWVNWEGYLVTNWTLQGLRYQAFCYWVGLTNMENKLAVGLARRRSQVVRQVSAKHLFVGSIPTVASRSN